MGIGLNETHMEVLKYLVKNEDRDIPRSVLTAEFGANVYNKLAKLILHKCIDSQRQAVEGKNQMVNFYKINQLGKDTLLRWLREHGEINELQEPHQKRL